MFLKCVKLGPEWESVNVMWAERKERWPQMIPMWHRVRCPGLNRVHSQPHFLLISWLIAITHLPPRHTSALPCEFSEFGLLSSSEGKSKTHKDVLDKMVLSTLWQQFGESLFLFQHDSAPVYKASSIKKCFPCLVWKNLTGESIKHLWDELERRLWPRPDHATSVLDRTSALVAEWERIPAAGSTSGGKPETRRFWGF